MTATHITLAACDRHDLCVTFRTGDRDTTHYPDVARLTVAIGPVTIDLPLLATPPAQHGTAAVLPDQVATPGTVDGAAREGRVPSDTGPASPTTQRVSVFDTMRGLTVALREVAA